MADATTALINNLQSDDDATRQAVSRRRALQCNVGHRFKFLAAPSTRRPSNLATRLRPGHQGFDRFSYRATSCRPRLPWRPPSRRRRHP